MSFVAIYELNCDNNCGAAYPAPFPTLHEPEDMEAAALAEGWKVVFGGSRATRRRHHCPDCGNVPEATS